MNGITYEMATFLTKAIKQIAVEIGKPEILDGLPKCNCSMEAVKGKAHEKYSDVCYRWYCPLHGERGMVWFDNAGNILRIEDELTEAT